MRRVICMLILFATIASAGAQPVAWKPEPGLSIGIDVESAEVDIAASVGVAGGSTHAAIYRSARNRPGQAQATPVVIVPAVGIDLMTGARTRAIEREPFLIYLKLGMLVIFCDTDGPLTIGPTTAASSASTAPSASPSTSPSKPPDADEYIAAVQAFIDSDGGVRNVRDAIDWTIANISEANPSRIYLAGASGSAALALRVAADDPRVAAVVAIDPPADFPAAIGPTLPMLDQAIPGLRQFAEQSSPARFAGRIRTATLLINSTTTDADSAAPEANDAAQNDSTRRLVEQMTQLGNAPTRRTAPPGVTRDMPSPEAIETSARWLAEQKPTTAPPATMPAQR